MNIPFTPLAHHVRRYLDRHPDVAGLRGTRYEWFDIMRRMKRSLPNHLVALPLVLVACGAGAPVGAAGQRGPSGAGDSSGVDGGGNGQEYDTATGILFVSGRLYAVDAVADRVVRFAA